MIRIPAAAAAAAILTGLIYLSVHPYAAVTRLGAVPFAVTLWALFAGGAWLVRHIPGRWAVALILAGGIAVQLAALSAPPRSSDDLYRYIWDGRVQAAGIDPYQYVPAARQLVPLRDPLLWPGAPHAIWCVKPGTREAGAQLVSGCARINRPTVHTIYPPVAEAYFLGVHYLSPPGGRTIPIQAGAAFCAVALTLLLLYGLGRLGKDRRLAVLWAWCPLVALEAGNNAHVNVLAAGIAAAALMVLAKPGRLRRSLTGGALIGLAICTKVTPLLDRAGRATAAPSGGRDLRGGLCHGRGLPAARAGRGQRGDRLPARLPAAGGVFRWDPVPAARRAAAGEVGHRGRVRHPGRDRPVRAPAR